MGGSILLLKSHNTYNGKNMIRCVVLASMFQLTNLVIWELFIGTFIHEFKLYKAVFIPKPLDK